MHLFDKEDPSQTQLSFYISIALFSAITYAVSGFSLWKVSPDDGRARLMTWFGKLTAKPQRKVTEKKPKIPGNESKEAV
jgi:hypothetical protein